MDKDDIRRQVRARKRLLTDDERLSAARGVFDRLETLAAFVLSDHILAYNSLPDELSTREFLRRWSGSKRLYLPRVNGIDLDLLPYEQTSLRAGTFHIEEPTGDDIVDPRRIEMVIVPAMAYDRQGNRVGRGKGYYDRLLTQTKAFKVGVAYDFQLFDNVDAEPHDIPVDIVVTESRIIRRPRRR